VSILEGEPIRSEQQLAVQINLFLNCFSIDTDLLLIAILYLDKIVVRCDDDFYLTPSNIKHAFFGCLVMAAKFYDDRFETNTIFSAIIGIKRL